MVAAQLAASLIGRSDEITVAMWHDYELLKAMAAREGWTDESPVDVALLGPLWPEGEPDGWPVDARKLPRPFSLAIDPGEADMETIREVLSALSDLHEVHTGHALIYEFDGALIHAAAEVPA